jgi:hypothetical protein
MFVPAATWLDKVCNEHLCKGIRTIASHHRAGCTATLELWTTPYQHIAAELYHLAHSTCLIAQVGVTNVAPEALQQALAADVITFGSPSAVK